MKKAIKLLKKWASGKLVLGLFMVTMAVYLTMLFYTLPAVEKFAPGTALFDLCPTGYSYDYAISLLKTLGPEGRNMYRNLQLPLDFIYPGLFAVSYSLLLTWVFGKGYAPNSKMFNFAVIPTLGGTFDYLENIGILQMIKSYPDVPSGLVRLTSTFTILKSGFTTIFFILLLVGGFRVMKRRQTHPC